MSNPSEIQARLQAFVEYTALLRGDEKGEAQVFCDRLFVAFGHKGYKEAGATLEERLKGVGGRKGTSFADLIWKPRLLLEMKRRGENLRAHYKQAFDYWVYAVPRRPRYVILCNFDEFWVFDFDRQIDQPVDVVRIEDLPRRFTALNFLFPEEREPQFGNDLEAVTREAADMVARVFSSMVERGVDRAKAQRQILQLVVAMFAEDIDLMPRGTVHGLLEDAKSGQGSTYDLLGGLFRQMNSATRAPAGRYQQIPYFNGGLFSVIDPIELNKIETILLIGASKRDWSKVNPAVFGTLFQGSMDKEERHALGAHFTSEADILRVVNPTIVRPWTERIESAASGKALLALRNELHRLKVLDPACGSGNFLYVAYREIARLEVLILERLAERAPDVFEREVKGIWLIPPSNFFGIEKDAFGVEIAKVTLMLAKKLALDEMRDALKRDQIDLPYGEDALPLDNLDGNFQNTDALFAAWPQVDAIIGNPPFQSKNKMIGEFGRAYVNQIRRRYPDIPGRADYCVYWFRRAHDELAVDARAGLVGTNSIRQTYSRQGGLDYIVAHGGTITDAVATQVWSGDAVVHVSIVNWIKGDHDGKRTLAAQLGDDRDSPWDVREVDSINAALSFGVDVTQVGTIRINAAVGGCFQGQTHGHPGFLLSARDAAILLARSKRNREVLHPYLTTDGLLGNPSNAIRYVIDFGQRNMPQSQEYKDLFDIVERKVLPAKKAAAKKEQARNNEATADDARAKTAHHHEGSLNRWWQLFWPRAEMMKAIAPLSRYIACGCVTKRPIFEVVSSTVHPNAALMVFPYADDYSFGVLQSDVHWQWFVNRCSTLKGDPRYTSNTVFDTFPWPQEPSIKAISEVAQAAVALRQERRRLQASLKCTLRELYRDLEKPGDHPLKSAQATLDQAVRRCYGMKVKEDSVRFILQLNAEVVAAERRNEPVTGPGLPQDSATARRLSTSDCLQADGGFSD